MKWEAAVRSAASASPAAENRARFVLTREKAEDDGNGLSRDDGRQVINSSDIKGKHHRHSPFHITSHKVIQRNAAKSISVGSIDNDSRSCGDGSGATDEAEQ
jgi:hypothetical protein